MAICNGCGGVVGRDCFNPTECEWISHDMERRRQEEYYSQHQEEWHRLVVSLGCMFDFNTSGSLEEIAASAREACDRRVASLQPAQEPVADYKGWYCAHCQRGVDGSEVTFREQHTVCGRVITDDVPPAAQKSADDKREMLHEFVNLCFQCARYERPSTDWIAAGDELLPALAADRKREGDPIEKALAQERHEFKNFHRQLCERFDYCHDEVDWKRDQVSLIEHIAKRSAAPVSAGLSVSPELLADCIPPTAVFSAVDNYVRMTYQELQQFARALSSRLLPPDCVAVPREPK
jgi:hypothetical protein